MKKNINKYIKFITIISLFTQLNAMEQDNNKRKLPANINNNNSNKKPRNESKSKTDTDNENNQHCSLLELPSEMQILILFHTIENIINDSSDIFNVVSDVSKFIYNISLTHRNFYDFKRDLFKHTASCLKDKFTKDRIYTLANLTDLLKLNDRQEEIYIAKTIISDIYYDSKYGYPSKTILNYIIEKNYKKALKVAKFYKNINPIINNNPNNKCIIDNTKDMLISHPEIKNAIELALNNNDINNLKKYLEILKPYLNNPYDINYIITSNSVSLLIEAIIKDKIEVIKVLLEYNIDINAIYKHLTYPTALQAAILKNNINILKLLLEKGANPDMQGIYNLTPLMTASSLQDKEEIVIELLKYTKDINHKDDSGSNALIYAVQNGHTDIVRLLLQKNANIDMQSNIRNTALILAAQNGHKDIVRLLLDKDANINIKDNAGCTALIRAVMKGHTDIAKLLIAAGTDINIQNNNRCTTLIYAAYNNHTDIVRLLLDKDANVNIKDNNGCTALIFAAQNGHINIVRSLIQKDADVNMLANNGCTALILAAQNGHADIVRLLLQKNANVDIQTNKGWTALILAAQNGHTDIVRLLLQENANVDMQTNNEWTALISQHKMVIQILCYCFCKSMLILI